jgi:hypothetical protein
LGFQLCRFQLAVTEQLGTACCLFFQLFTAQHTAKQPLSSQLNNALVYMMHLVLLLVDVLQTGGPMRWHQLW